MKKLYVFLLTMLIMGGVNMQKAVADCTIPVATMMNPTTNASVYFKNTPTVGGGVGCTGKLIVPSGAVFNFDAVATGTTPFPAGITTIEIQNGGKVLINSNYIFPSTLTFIDIQDSDYVSCTPNNQGILLGGQIIWTSNFAINIGLGTSINIDNICDLAEGTGNNPGTAALAGQTSNVTRINIGGQGYATGEGNNECIRFDDLILAGGTIKIDPTSTSITGAVNGKVCNAPFNIVTTLTGFLYATNASPITFTWENVSGPNVPTINPTTANVTSLTGVVPNLSASATTSITNVIPGDYVFLAKAKVFLSSRCPNTFIEIEKRISITLIPTPIVSLTIKPFYFM